jgi:hypothetical protein
MADHLCECAPCQQLVLGLEAPLRRIFGRPVLAAIKASALDIERYVEQLWGVCNVAPTGLISVSGRSTETLAYQVASIAIGRLGRIHRRSIRVEGMVRTNTELPRFDGDDVIVWLDEGWIDLAFWQDVAQRSLVLIIAAEDTWARLGVSPTIAFTDSRLSPGIVEAATADLLAAIQAGPPAVRAGVLANSLFADWLSCRIGPGEAIAAPFVAVENKAGVTGWLSVESPWIARRLFAARPRLAAEVWDELMTFLDFLPAGLAQRLESGWKNFLDLAACER